jgi:hypothetical protein
MKPNIRQTHQHKTDFLTQTPDSRLNKTLPDPTMGATVASFAFLTTAVATVRIK